MENTELNRADDWTRNKNEILSRFVNEATTIDEVMALYYKDAMFHAVVECILRNDSPYRLLVEMTKDRISMQKEFTRYVELNPNPYFNKQK